MAARAHLGVAELVHVAGLHLAAELRGHGLHAVADAEHGHAELPDRSAARAGAFGCSTDSGPPERMMPLGWKATTSASLDVPGMDLAVDAELAHAARDELRVLRAEVEDEDAVGVDVVVGGGLHSAFYVTRLQGAIRAAAPTPVNLQQHRDLRRWQPRPPVDHRAAPARL